MVHPYLGCHNGEEPVKYPSQELQVSCMYLHPGELNIDREGVLWWGSDDKLISFDGYNYTSYNLPDHLNPYADHSLILFIYQDKQGTCWTFIANNRLYTFNPVNLLIASK